uniref:Putative RNA recognition motif-containing protein n=1 Tax=Davidia involucrata TaxID=16924 RepID=A0A5B7BSY7_DAVIN
MSGNAGCTVYIGSLDERVSDRVLYDILIQAGRVVDLYIPRDKETDRPKGYAFAEYETEEIADYAVRLFSGLVTLYNRTLKFAISGQDKPSLNLPTATTPALNSSLRPRPHPVPFDNLEVSPHSMRLSTPCRVLAHQINYAQVPVPPGVIHQPNGYRSPFDGNNYDYSRRVFGATLDSIGRSRSSRYDTSNPTKYSS